MGCQSGQLPAAIAGVVSNHPDFAELCASHGVPFHHLALPAGASAQAKRAQEREVEALIEAEQIDLVVLAGYLKLVPAAVIAAYRGRIINIHPALLPEFGGKGMYGLRVHQAVLASGTPESGATVHLVDEVYDHGAVLAQARVPVLPGDTPDTLAERVLSVEHRLLPAAVIAAAIAGRPIPLTPDSRLPTPD